MKRKIFLGNIKYENPKVANNACYVEITYKQKTENKWVFSATGEIWNKNRSDILYGTSWQYMPIPQNDHEKIMKLFKG